jgi:callose synthase
MKRNRLFKLKRNIKSQAIDMNMDLGLEEALKMRWFLQELQFSPRTGAPRFTLVGCPEVIYTEELNSAGRYMALQDLSFVTIVQRMLSFTNVRMHYG